MVAAQTGIPKGPGDVRFGSLGDITALIGNVLLYPQKRIWIKARWMFAKCRFCCRSDLKALANSDSVALTRSALEADDDGAA